LVGYGIVSGLRATRGEFIGWTHADSQYDPRYVVDGFARLLAAPQPAQTGLQGSVSAATGSTARRTSSLSLILGTIGSSTFSI
jgi:hypothetical protein